MPELMGFEAFDDIKRLIVIAAHPDDLETMCGGTIALLVARGVEVFSANCTLGDIGTQESGIVRPVLAATRLTETAGAARILGIKQTYNLGHHDGELEANLELRAQIARLYRITQADALFTFDPYWTGQIHPDHRAAGQAALERGVAASSQAEARHEKNRDLLHWSVSLMTPAGAGSQTVHFAAVNAESARLFPPDPAVGRGGAWGALM